MTDDKINQVMEVGFFAISAAAVIGVLVVVVAAMGGAQWAINFTS
jgi:hypothetical protein